MRVREAALATHVPNAFEIDAFDSEFADSGSHDARCAPSIRAHGHTTQALAR